MKNILKVIGILTCIFFCVLFGYRIGYIDGCIDESHRYWEGYTDGQKEGLKAVRELKEIYTQGIKGLERLCQRRGKALRTAGIIACVEWMSEHCSCEVNNDR